MVSLHRFFVAHERIKDGYVIIEGDEAKHLSKVLRLGPGDEVLVCDGSGKELLVRLETAEKGLIKGRVVNQNHPEREPGLTVGLAQGVGKGEKMDFIVQKAVELGISRIYPVMTDRGTVRLDGERAFHRVQRWEKIAKEACKQCGRTVVPEIKGITDLTVVMDECRDIPGLFFYEGEWKRPLKTILRENARILRDRGVILYIGAEGGFSLREAETARKRGILMAGLGPRILRTETAALAAITAVMYELGDLGGN